ncbi:hypothetical protein HTZ97_09370 [Desulfuromonas acetoxidans]|uniref:Uncharacterized protein n=1 Tax=Desulfuromonas acetoxidans (strain DSM 684 / 11070) TaxID=281689 RepID=Q1JYR6_DESA6|nr:hypothetical protein [Desulfuromonas acetoxidans]EAT15349.1 hypothetical protein Dace_1013 [Desulfuromonas acetoxidans DSM 684]MBF0646407.1 hypothetical protein [Desulfuromonas acetoxidans]NVD24378.1 hypothetical protein [Desulfuromonas acetoxidans]NVE16674.1 hypothetical protein [Desulfuromonas acetoxidans]
MPGNKGKDLKLRATLSTEDVKRGTEQIKADLAKLKTTATGWTEQLTQASKALDVRPLQQINLEARKLQRQYEILKNSGGLTGRELSQAAENLKRKTAELYSQQKKMNASLESGQQITGRMAGSVKNLVAAYVGLRTITGLYSTISTASRDAEQAQFNLTSSVQAASREFENTGGLDAWQSKIKELSADLRIYSESDVANAAARTIDMTKRLGLSAEQMNILIQRTADLSAGKTDLEGGIERVTAALRGEAEASEYLGLTLNETYVKSWYEANNASGKAWKTLTDIEKAQIRYNVLLEQSDAIQGRAAASSNTYNGALQLVQASVHNAVANNEDLTEAMTGVANIISENADEIGEFATEIATAIGDVIEFTIENKELVTALIGAGGLVFALGKTAKTIKTVSTIMKDMSMAKTPELLSSGMANSRLPKLNNALGKAGLAGALFSVGYAIGEALPFMTESEKIMESTLPLIDEYADLHAAVAEKIQQISRETGILIENEEHLYQLEKDGVLVYNEKVGAYEAVTESTRQMTAAEKALQEQRVESFASIATYVDEVQKKYGDLSVEAFEASRKQSVLNEALANSKNPVEAAKQNVDKLAETYVEAKDAS